VINNLLVALLGFLRAAEETAYFRVFAQLFRRKSGKIFTFERPERQRKQYG
jgi:hypothetical protein